MKKRKKILNFLLFCLLLNPLSISKAKAIEKDTQEESSLTVTIDTKNLRNIRGYNVGMIHMPDLTSQSDRIKHMLSSRGSMSPNDKRGLFESAAEKKERKKQEKLAREQQRMSSQGGSMFQYQTFGGGEEHAALEFHRVKKPGVLPWSKPNWTPNSDPCRPDNLTKFGKAKIPIDPKKCEGKYVYTEQQMNPFAPPGMRWSQRQQTYIPLPSSSGPSSSSGQTSSRSGLIFCFVRQYNVPIEQHRTCNCRKQSKNSQNNSQSQTVFCKLRSQNVDKNWHRQNCKCRNTIVSQPQQLHKARKVYCNYMRMLVDRDAHLRSKCPCGAIVNT